MSGLALDMPASCIVKHTVLHVKQVWFCKCDHSAKQIKLHAVLSGSLRTFGVGLFSLRQIPGFSSSLSVSMTGVLGFKALSEIRLLMHPCQACLRSAAHVLLLTVQA